MTAKEKAERYDGMKNISPKEAIEVLKDMKIEISLPKAATTQRKRNAAIEMAIDALRYSELPNSSGSISRQAAIDALDKRFDSIPMELTTEILMLRKNLRELPSTQPEQRWIPFVLRPATDEEKEVFPGLDYYLEGKLPEDGQKILITVRLPGHEEVQVDEFYSDDDGSYLDGQYEIGTEAVAWMPLPEPYKEEKK